MSTSTAPLATAFFVSKAFSSDVFAPSGKPITVHTLTSESFNSSAAYSTHVGFKHTEKSCVLSLHQ